MRMTNTVPAFAALLVLTMAGASAYAATLPKIAKGTPYAKARTTLSALGYRGVAPDGGGSCGTRDDICKKWPETEGCGGTGIAPCSFVWRKGAQVVEIETHGERPPVVNRILCRQGC